MEPDTPDRPRPPRAAPGDAPDDAPGRRPRAAGRSRRARPEDVGPDRGYGRVLCFGAAHWDVIGRPALPFSGRFRRGDDIPGAVVTRPGGVALNIAAALIRRRRPAVLVAPIGEDPGGMALLARLRDAGVGCRRIATGEPTGRYLAIES
jgi:hypothetical protein